MRGELIWHKIQHVNELLKLLAAFTGDPAYGDLIPSNSKGLTQGFEEALIISVTGITQECLDTIKNTLQPSE